MKSSKIKPAPRQKIFLGRKPPKKRWLFIKKLSVVDVFFLGLLVLFLLLFILLSLIRHEHFQSFIYDLGVYDQAIWLYSRFKTPISTIILRPQPIHIWADHFAPSLMFLAPLYWLSDHVRWLLILQAAIVVFGTYPIYKLAKDRLNNPWLGLILGFSYLFFAGTQNAIAFDFHPETVATASLAWLLYALERNNWSWYFLLLLISLGFKENVASLLAAFGLGLILTKKVKIGLLTFALSTFWYLGATKIISPGFGQFIYEPQIPNSFFIVLKDFFLPMIKLETIILTLASFLFLPIFYLPSLLVVLEQFFERFVASPAATRWTLGMHYSILLTPFLVYGTIKTLAWINRRGQMFISLGIMLSLLVINIKTHASLNILAKKDFYRQEKWLSQTKEVLKRVPPEASLATQNNLGAHLAHREKLYLLPNILEAEYILVDFHSGQNANNFFPAGEERLKKLIFQLENEGKYVLEYQRGEVLLLRRK